MIIDQKQIDALVADATAGNASEPPEAHAKRVTSPTARGAVHAPSAPELQHILRLRVPVIVRLADRRMAVSEIVRLSPGAMIEFDRGDDADLELMINNRVIARGSAVKVGENFGLKLTNIGDVRHRIRSMGG
ncbi:MAG: Flagellar motor switch protein FliN [Phycisphaerae bacterium]|nr:Flagellar motor switch protein FliN [Phycisphaerae bacterium]